MAVTQTAGLAPTCRHPPALHEQFEELLQARRARRRLVDAARVATSVDAVVTAFGDALAACRKLALFEANERLTGPPLCAVRLGDQTCARPAAHGIPG